MPYIGARTLAPGQATAPKALKETRNVKGTHRRLVVALAFLLVVAVASAVLAAQAKAGDGLGFRIVKAIADTGGADIPVVTAKDGAAAGMSCGMDGGGCAAGTGASGCSMGKPDAADADGPACGATAPEADTETAEAPANCPSETGVDCSDCDLKDTCPVHQTAETADAPKTN